MRALEPWLTWVSLTSDGAADKRLDEDGLLIQKVAKDYTIVRAVLLRLKSRWLTLNSIRRRRIRAAIFSLPRSRTCGMN